MTGDEGSIGGNCQPGSQHEEQYKTSLAGRAFAGVPTACV
jgi:hypothetical protein